MPSFAREMEFLLLEPLPKSNILLLARVALLCQCLDLGSGLPGIGPLNHLPPLQKGFWLAGQELDSCVALWWRLLCDTERMRPSHNGLWFLF